MNTRNFELLKDAYQIIGGIPEKQIMLHAIVTKGGYKRKGTIACGTIACAAGWLALHPLFQEKGYKYEDGMLQYKGEKFVRYSKALSDIFGIPEHVASHMFGVRQTFERVGANANLSDKEIWLQRVRNYLGIHGQLKEQLEGKVKA